jgi:anti-sigma regulatory factor (Ser/Thr protein kinase)
MTITDSGSWGRHHPAAPAPAARGHGLTIMRGCTEEMHIQHSEAGTTIILISRSVPAGS